MPPPAPSLTRRRFAAGALALPALLAGCAHGGAGTAAPVVEVAPGVYMLPGSGGEVDPANRGRIGNAGFIVGSTGVIAIDTGTSARHGEALLAAIAGVTDKPVLLALVTHARQEFLFGGSAFRDRGIPIHMQRRTAGLMKARCDGCLKRLNEQLGTAEMRGTAMYEPDVRFETAHVLELIGRPVRVLYWDHSSGPGDIAVLDETSGVLFAGGLLDARRVPDVQDAELDGWRQALVALGALKLQRVVPGHGPASPPALVGQVARYLELLEGRLIELADAGMALSEVPDAAALPDYRDWDQYDVIHRRNASIVFVRVEREQLLK